MKKPKFIKRIEALVDILRAKEDVEAARYISFFGDEWDVVLKYGSDDEISEPYYHAHSVVRTRYARASALVARWRWLVDAWSAT